MWIVKGVLVGPLFFIVGWITYFGIRIAIAFHQATQMAKAGVRQQGGTMYYRPWSQLISHNPILWITLLTAIAIGLWIMRPRAPHPITRGDGGAQWDIRIWLGLLHSPVFLGCVPGSDCNWVVDYESTSDPHSMRKGWEWLKKENRAPSYYRSFSAQLISLRHSFDDGVETPFRRPT